MGGIIYHLVEPVEPFLYAKQRGERLEALTLCRVEEENFGNFESSIARRQQSLPPLVWLFNYLGRYGVRSSGCF